jgi:hypothetical protein
LPFLRRQQVLRVDVLQTDKNAAQARPRRLIYKAVDAVA